MANCSQEIVEYSDCTLTTCRSKATPIGPPFIPGFSNLSIGLICLGVFAFLLFSAVTALGLYIYVLRRRNWERLRSPSTSEDPEDPIISEFTIHKNYFSLFCPILLIIIFLDLIIDPFPFPGGSQQGLNAEARGGDANDVPRSGYQDVPLDNSNEQDDPIGDFGTGAAASPPQQGSNKVQINTK